MNRDSFTYHQSWKLRAITTTTTIRPQLDQGWAVCTNRHHKHRGSSSSLESQTERFSRGWFLRRGRSGVSTRCRWAGSCLCTATPWCRFCSTCSSGTEAPTTQTWEASGPELCPRWRSLCRLIKLMLVTRIRWCRWIWKMNWMIMLSEWAMIAPTLRWSGIVLEIFPSVYVILLLLIIGCDVGYYYYFFFLGFDFLCI